MGFLKRATVEDGKPSLLGEKHFFGVAQSARCPVFREQDFEWKRSIGYIDMEWSIINMQVSRETVQA